MKASKKITIDGEKVEIKKMPIGRTAELMMAIEHLPSKLQNAFTLEELQNLDGQALFTKIPPLLRNSQDEIFSLVSIASRIEKEVIQNLGLDEFIDVILAIFEINNIKGIIDKVKNLGKVLQRNKN